jgi:FAD/FMN-containing dehydrogenase
MPLAAAAPALLAVQPGVLVNDVQTGWNPTIVERIERPRSAAEIQAIVRDCARNRQVISISASRHATGGQQFAATSILLDMRKMHAIRSLDPRTGILEIESGIEWPELIEGYLSLQKDGASWGIRQKQGGADRMSIGGALSANAHGHCLGAPPIVADVEWIEMVTADGKLHRCTRKQERELFSLAIGGYGLFGVITAAGLRLVPRRKVRRHVETRTAAELMGLIERRTKAGGPFGYFQYNVDETSLEFLRTGILTTYEAVPDATPLGRKTTEMDDETLVALLKLAHQDRKAAYGRYARFELSLDGNIEWSDLHQLANYPAGYHKKIQPLLGPESEGADLIWEFYVQRRDLIPFLEDARFLLLKSELPLIYGTVRFIEQDRDTFLPWAKKRYACVIFTRIAAMEKPKRSARAPFTVSSCNAPRNTAAVSISPTIASPALLKRKRPIRNSLNSCA